MGLILDSNILVACERRRLPIDEVALNARAAGELQLGISSVTVVELTHGIYRAESLSERERRKRFLSSVLGSITVYPLSVEIALLAGQIEGEQAAKGIGLPFEDLVIGATALSLGFRVATLNVKHFRLIPRLEIVSI